ncbi:MAG: hypothetical protein ACJAUP_001240 [Cellvibrionaceae bacterium]|jgi:hypothetical protein
MTQRGEYVKPVSDGVQITEIQKSLLPHLVVRVTSLDTPAAPSILSAQVGRHQVSRKMAAQIFDIKN